MFDWPFRQSRSIYKEIDMNLIKPHWLAVILLAAYSIPGSVLAETVTVAGVTSVPTNASEAVDAAPADRMELTPSPNLTGNNSMMLRPGMGAGGRPDRMGQRRDRSCNEMLIEHRLDTLETRMDTIQMMLRIMLDR
jgi:hypothetical protein